MPETELTIAGLRALLDAPTADAAPVGSTVRDTRDGEDVDLIRLGDKAWAWWELDADDEEGWELDAQGRMDDGAELVAVAVPVALLRELLARTEDAERRA
ncbi:hypothetical protein [Parafrankia sp. EUN1f]|uniref:hypothetical protein n=1 Tax=Parafrankia sp. EUN1f TaxID=102897 RepID=UPI0001C46465|nr:hypothetical protein [Parafrankia sp. EUN1f]EFC80901.1 hypothetical protein FrEUN1fDRAFT_6003 [Parafrankia sp. EUN1f]